MKKCLLLLLAGLSLNSYACVGGESNENCSSTKLNSSSPSSLIVGGWYPLFFTAYNQEPINNIRINKANIKSIEIMYEAKNKLLAEQIAGEINDTTSIPVTMNLVNMVDTESVQYEHSSVVVTVFNNRN